MGTIRELFQEEGKRREGSSLPCLRMRWGKEMASLSLVQKGGAESAKRQGLCFIPPGEVERVSPVRTFAGKLAKN